jgi:hypothetical protein
MIDQVLQDTFSFNLIILTQIEEWVEIFSFQSRNVHTYMVVRKFAEYEMWEDD